MLTYLQIFADKEELLNPFDDAERGRLLTAMLQYALHDTEIELTGNERYIWPVFRQMIDQSKDALTKKQNAGRARQDSMGQQTAAQDITAPADGSTNEQEPSTDKQTAAQAPIIQESRIKNQESGSKKQKEKGVKAVPHRFTAPTPDQVLDFCRENGIQGVDANRFVNFYASKGWKVGNTPMRDWHAAVRNWASKEQSPQASSRAVPRVLSAQNYTQREYTEEELGGESLNALLAEAEAMEREAEKKEAAS